MGKRLGDNRWISAIGKKPKRKSGNGRSKASSILKEKRSLRTQADPTPCDELVTLDHAIQRFFANLHSRGLSLATIKKNRVVIEKQLAAFCQSQGFRYIAQLGINQLDDFVATWKESAISKVKKIERLKGFFRFCLSRKMIQEDPSVNLCKPKCQ